MSKLEKSKMLEPTEVRVPELLSGGLVDSRCVVNMLKDMKRLRYPVVREGMDIVMEALSNG